MAGALARAFSITAVAAAYFYRRRQELSSWTGTGIFLAAFLCYLLTWNWWFQFSAQWPWITLTKAPRLENLPWGLALLPNRELLLAVASGLLIFALTTTRTPLRRLIEFKPLVFLGVMSYSFFLIHQPSAWFFSEFLTKRLHMNNGVLHWFLTCTIGLAVVIALAYLFFLVFEKPFLTVPKKEVITPVINSPTALATGN
ncbi:MAG: acyltransferase family protein [Phycisphaerae bacterium]